MGLEKETGRIKKVSMGCMGKRDENETATLRNKPRWEVAMLALSKTRAAEALTMRGLGRE